MIVTQLSTPIERLGRVRLERFIGGMAKGDKKRGSGWVPDEEIISAINGFAACVRITERRDVVITHREYVWAIKSLSPPTRYSPPAERRSNSAAACGLVRSELKRIAMQRVLRISPTLRRVQIPIVTRYSRARQRACAHLETLPSDELSVLEESTTLSFLERETFIVHRSGGRPKWPHRSTRGGNAARSLAQRVSGRER